MTDYIDFQTWICPKCCDDHSIFLDCTPVEIGVFMPSETDKSFIAEKYREQNVKIKELENKLTNYMLGFATQTERCELLEAKLSIAVSALKCNETFHRLGGIDDCEPCQALEKLRGEK